MTTGRGEPRERVERVTHRDVVLAEADARADVAIALLQEIAEAAHDYRSADGQVVRDAQGAPVEDAWPRLRALTEVRHWLEWKARLNGWYKQQATDVEVRSPDGTVLAVLHITAAGGADVTVVENAEVKTSVRLSGREVFEAVQRESERDLGHGDGDTPGQD